MSLASNKFIVNQRISVFGIVYWLITLCISVVLIYVDQKVGIMLSFPFWLLGISLTIGRYVYRFNSAPS